MSGHDGLYQSWIISKSLNWNPGKDLISLTKQIKLSLLELAANITRLGSSGSSLSLELQQRKFCMKIYIEGEGGREEGGSPSPMFNVGSPMVR